VLRTRFTELFEIEVPIVQAPIWPAITPELVAAVGEAGAIGSLSGMFVSREELGAQIGRVRELTDRPFIVNHVIPQLDQDTFEATLEAAPAGVSFALGDPGGLVARARDAGARVLQQVHTVTQARAAADLGVDVIIAQGSDAGGQGMLGAPGTLTLVPQGVDAVDPIPVLAAGGVADGRGLAAVLAAGAAGANIGTRFLASEEAAAHEDWKLAIIGAESEAATRLEQWAALFPPESEAIYPVVPRVLGSEFVERMRSSATPAADSAEAMRAEVIAAITDGRTHELVPFTGQTAGLIHETLPAAEIVRRMASEAEAAAARLGDSVG
jgi:enoyl-[acyl-carrier protein] reductase II